MKKILIVVIILFSAGCRNRDSLKKLEAEVKNFNENEITVFIRNPNPNNVFGVQVRTVFYNEDKEILDDTINEVPFIAANTTIPLILYDRPENTKYFNVSVDSFQKEAILIDYSDFVEFVHYDNGKYIVAHAENTSKKNIDIITANVVFYKNNKVVSVVKNSAYDIRPNGNVNLVFSYPEEFDFYNFKIENALVNLKKIDEKRTEKYEIKELLKKSYEVYYIIYNLTSSYRNPPLYIDYYDDKGNYIYNRLKNSTLVEPNGVTIVSFDRCNNEQLNRREDVVSDQENSKNEDINLYDEFEFFIDDTGEEIIISSQKITQDKKYSLVGYVVFYKDNVIVDIKDANALGGFSQGEDIIYIDVDYPFNFSFDRYEFYFSRVDVY